jgi:hypothetical protein
MELWIPSQTLDIYNIHVTPFQPQISQKIMVAPLKYIDNNVTLDNVVILTPPLEVIFHDLQSGKLILSLAEQQQFAVKLNTLQTYLASTLYLHQQTFFGFMNPILTAEFFKKLIFPLVYNKKLTIYMGASSRTVRVYEKNMAADAVVHQGIHRSLVAGEKVRIALQLQGISILTTPALSILQSLTAPQMDISGANMCRIRFQQSARAIYIV